MKRSEVKNKHEEAVLNNFKKHIQSLNKTIEIIDRPEPPDAIVRINGNATWIEITDAFFNPELAESMTSYVANDKSHRPVPKEKRFYIEPNEHFSNVLKSVIIKKYIKESIGNIYKQYGSGILLVGIINPFSTAKELINTEKLNILEAIESEEKRFNEIYFYDIHEHTFHRLL